MRLRGGGCGASTASSGALPDTIDKTTKAKELTGDAFVEATYLPVSLRCPSLSRLHLTSADGGAVCERRVHALAASSSTPLLLAPPCDAIGPSTVVALCPTGALAASRALAAELGLAVVGEDVAAPLERALPALELALLAAPPQGARPRGVK